MLGFSAGETKQDDPQSLPEAGLAEWTNFTLKTDFVSKEKMVVLSMDSNLFLFLPPTCCIQTNTVLHEHIHAESKHLQPCFKRALTET